MIRRRARFRRWLKVPGMFREHYCIMRRYNGVWASLRVACLLARITL